MILKVTWNPDPIQCFQDGCQSLNLDLKYDESTRQTIRIDFKYVGQKEKRNLMNNKVQILKCSLILKNIAKALNY